MLMCRCLHPRPRTEVPPKQCALCQPARRTQSFAERRHALVHRRKWIAFSTFPPKTVLPCNPNCASQHFLWHFPKSLGRVMLLTLALRAMQVLAALSDVLSEWCTSTCTVALRSALAADVLVELLRTAAARRTPRTSRSLFQIIMSRAMNAYNGHLILVGRSKEARSPTWRSFSSRWQNLP